MALNPEFRHPMYLLGRLVARLEGPFPDQATMNKMIGGILDNLLTRPATTLVLVLKKFPDHRRDPSVAEVMMLLPADLPKGPVDIEEQSFYWTGYYHQRYADQSRIKEASKNKGLVERFTPAVIEQIGVALFGPDHWQAEMARALDLSDSSRVRDWTRDNEAKRRSVPAGVCWDLLAMLRQKSAAAKQIADEIDKPVE